MATLLPTARRGGKRIAYWLLLPLLWLSSLGATAQSATYAPTVTSDKDDYSPGQVAHITGTGWTQDQMVHVEFKEEPDYPDYHTFDVPADADGHWQIDYNIELRHLGVKFTVKAVGQTTRALAETIFTDGPGLLLTAFTPTRNARAVSLTSPVAATFDLTLLDNAAVKGSLKVFGQQAGGKKAGTATIGGTDNKTLTFTPAAAFKPGETVSATITSAIESDKGNKNLVPGQVFQFTAAAGVAPGTFSGGSEVSAANAPVSVTLGDVDGDGDLDMLVPSTSTSTVAIRLNNGTGSFTAPATNAQVTTGSQTYCAALGDIDSDGDLDLVTANYSSTNASVRLNNGAGVFTGPATNAEVPVGSGAYNIALGDLDADGDLDLVATNSAGTASVRFNNGLGSFTAPAANAQVTVGVNPSYVALGDIDNDGDLDLLASNYSSGTVSVRLNNGAGVFTSPATNAEVSVGTAPISLVMGDVDADGDLDLLTASNVLNSLSVRLNNGLGSFTAPSTNAQVALGSSDNRRIALGDIDGDGDLDVLTPSVTTNRVIIRLNNGSGVFTAPATNPEVAVGGYPQQVALGDIDGDRDLDMVVANQFDNSTSVRLNQAVAPTITSLAPAAGPVGTSVLITGTNFTDASQVTFNGTAAPGFVVNSATQITVSVPAGATTGPVLVTRAGQSSNGVPFTVQQSQTITLAAISNKVYGDAPFTIAPTASSGLPVSIAVSGPASYTSATGEVVITGIGDVTLTASQAGNANYLAAPVVTQTFTVAAATPDLSWAPLPDITYGDDLSGKLTAVARLHGSEVAGSYAYKLGPTVLTSATRLNAQPTAYTLTVEFTPASPNYTAASGTNALLVRKANQTITWPAPDAITYGAALAAAQLNATVQGVANGTAPGALTYSPTAGTVLNAGPDQTLTVQAAATDNYNAASKSVLLTVGKATPAVTATGGSFNYAKQPRAGSGQATGIGAVVLTPVALSYAGTGATTYGPTSAAPTQAGTYTVTASYAGDDNYESNASTPASLTISPAVITASFTAADKQYDATDAASISGRALQGVIAGDVVSLSGGTALFADKNVGTAKTVTGSGFDLSGAAASNYTLGAAPVVLTTTAAITAVQLTAHITALGKVYDGTTAAELSSQTVTGMVGGETEVSLLVGAKSFDARQAGSRTVTARELGLDGPAAANYALAPNATATAPALITPKTVTPTFTAASKAYDGTTAATILTRTLSGVIDGDVTSLAGGTATFSSKEAGFGKTVTGTGFTLDGADAPNYTLAPGSITTVADITTVALSAHVSAADKVYDGTSTATLTAQSVSGQHSGDDVALAVASASFASKAAGAGKTVTASGLVLTGSDAGNYTVSATATTTADITPRPVTAVLTATSKIYDGTSAASASGSLPVGAVLGADAVAVAVVANSAEFDNASVGTGKPVTATVTLTGADAGNYGLTAATAATKASITAKDLTPSFTASGKVYDGTTDAEILTRLLTGIVGTDDVVLSGGTAAFADKTVGSGKTVTGSGFGLGGAAAGNYTLSTATATTLASITAADLTASFAAASKVYDGTTAATITSRYLSGKIIGDIVSLTGGTATFATKTVGQNKTVTASGLTLTGADAGNYSISGGATTTASITPATLMPSFTAANKVYDGTPTATILTRTVSGGIGTDAVALSGGTALFADKTVGTGKTVTGSDFTLSGADASNYQLPVSSPTAPTTTANITARGLTITATGVNKLFDGNTTATVTLSDNRVAGDKLTTAYASAFFADANVQASKPVTVTGITLAGVDAGNYTFNTTAGATAAIIVATSATALAHAGSVQYSDQVSFTATVTSPSAQAVLGTLTGTVDFFLTAGSSTVLLGTAAFPGAGGQTTVARTFAIGQKPGSYGVKAIFTPTSANMGGATSPVGSLTVRKENAGMVYAGLEYFGTSNSTSATANVEYIATVTDTVDAARGNVTNARAAFKEVNGLTETNLFGTTSFAVGSISTTENVVGTARSGLQTVTLSPTDFNNGGRTFDLLTEAQGDYYTGRTTEHTLITIAVPGQDYVNGGGSVVVAQSGGTYAAPAGSRMNFGFTMKWNKTGKNIQGQANIIFRRLVGSVWRTYQIKSNAINTLGTTSNTAGNQGDFNTKANLTDITNPLSPVSLGGGLDLSVQAFESTVTGKAHKIGVTLRASSGELMFSSNWVGGKTELLELKGGKISVRSSTSITPTPAKATAAQPTVTATRSQAEASALEVYPNPMADQGMIQFYPRTGGKAQVYLYNDLGALVLTLYNADVESGRGYFLPLSRAELPNGVYVCRLILNGTVENKRISIVR